MATIVDKNYKIIKCDDCNSQIAFNTEKDDSILTKNEVVTDDCTSRIIPALIKKYHKDIKDAWIDYGYDECYSFPKNSDMCISSDYYNVKYSIKCPCCGNIIETKIHTKTDTYIKIYPPEVKEGGDSIWIKIS